jgi:hypothetical protein
MGVPEICEEGDHFDVLNYSEFWSPQSEMHNDCQTTACSVHDECPESDETATAVANAVDSRDASGLAELIAEDGSITLDAARQAIQVLGCSDRVLLDLDLGSALWDELERAQRNKTFDRSPRPIASH